jgi:ABC-type amino acid transport substrate-binding protein
MTKNEWRLKKFDIVPLFSNRMMVIIPKSKKSQFKSNANLAGKTTALTKNSSFHIWLVEQNKKKYLSNPVKIQLMSYYKILEALKTETIDFMLQDSDMAIVNVRDNLKNCQVAFPVGPIEEIGWAFSKKDK